MAIIVLREKLFITVNNGKKIFKIHLLCFQSKKKKNEGRGRKMMYFTVTGALIEIIKISSLINNNY